MTHLIIRIQELSERDKPLFPEIPAEDEIEIHGEAEYFGIIEGGMKSGETSVSIIFRDEDGFVSLTQMSSAQFKVCYSALLGAEERFKNKHKNG